MKKYKSVFFFALGNQYYRFTVCSERNIILFVMHTNNLLNILYLHESFLAFLGLKTAGTVKGVES
jgi:hypothetical protein